MFSQAKTTSPTGNPCVYARSRLRPKLTTWQLLVCQVVVHPIIAYRIQSLFNSLGDEVKGKTIGLGGDGRYYNKEAAQIIVKMAAAAGVKKVCAMSVRSQSSAAATCNAAVVELVHSLKWGWTVQVLVGQNAIMATPAMSALIRRRKLYGKTRQLTLNLMQVLTREALRCNRSSTSHGCHKVHLTRPAPH